MLNKVTLIGNLGRDPEFRHLDSGQGLAQFSMATNRRWNDAEGNRHEATDWHQIVCFGRRAEIAAQYLTRGRQVYLEGRLQTRSWEDSETGQRRYRTEVVCLNFQMLGARPNGDGAAAQGEPAELDSEPEDDDIPF